MRRKLRKLFFKLKLIFFTSLVILFIGSIVFIIQFEKHIIPTAILLTEKYATNIINTQINESVQEVITSIDLTKVSFFDSYSSGNNGTNYLNVNNILINDICNKISSNLSEKLSKINDSKISLQLGNLTGINFFSNFGPKINVIISSIGEAIVDYETKFEAVGINQINFQVWLEISTQIGIINTLYSDQVNVKRNLMLINTIFNGEVPNTYFNMQQQN